MSKQVDFIREEEKLSEILEILNKEILKYLEKRKNVTNYILEARKKYVEEYKDDEDQIIDYFDHENYVKEEAYRTIDKRLMEFTKLKEIPYFGKVSFKEGEDIPEDMYVGRYGLTLENSFEPLIVDWRAPIASLFYKGTLGKSSYNPPSGEIEVDILSRKQLVIKKGQLKGVFDSAIDVKDEILQMVLTDNSSDKLKDIVMTIQKEQDEIIREDRNKIVVVNGVAGSGKTTIALHRISYLLYNFRKQFGDKVLIFGPNDIFMDYIAQVLPSLGESNIKQTTFENFAKKEINLKYENVKSFGSYIEDAMNGKDDTLEEYRYKSSKAFVDLLNSNLEILNKEYFKIQPIRFKKEEIVTAKEIEELFTNYYKDMPLFRRSEKIKRILISKIKDKRDEEVYKINAEFKEKISSLPEKEREIEKNNLEYLKKIKIREIIRAVMKSRDELDTWIKYEPVIDIYKRIINLDTDKEYINELGNLNTEALNENKERLSYMDLSGILYLMIKLKGIKVKNEIKHIVIDEAQDYSFIQFEIIKEMTGCKSYTIVGDSNQRLITTSEEPAMLHLDDVFKDLNVEITKYELNKSYRSTQEIMEYSNKFLDKDKIVPLVRKGEPVIEEEVSNNEEFVDTIISLIEDYEEEGYENIAVIFKDKNELNKFSHVIKEKINVQSLDNDDIMYKGGKVLLPAYLAKGLEFDGVIIVESEEIEPLVKYIMCTRALHRLSAVRYLI
ncbi:RNA polymerase recycling motor HelD [Clostridium beijerinckii]|uniref:DNA helicase-2/ATP-dependent DNA helicase PcrA n=1 Tax=Clostridium beijerinckii TaxID=1520 RepID=A0A9Q5GST1_CLOBE|nr:RNA polymerase recycling motor HelD [Clostridium beijerinckii]AQS07645.1 helicase IV [Clostridium beijerinckii]MBA2884273.1 DNA helicase-2/ATP-dependent DNA helicase PcrA [Clostridium beijerinckii]MBA2898342.1 DNA helicase-2/ATP-dependent DNA helicase PcrA [Clostridium beijerinckii]MBA2908872.1 DNA helicase-2/ATP-dependent DNA helicase PcrA [Clostridium beijerinckii]MBA9012717.1 DNA helicase-2/ATP-dependent DNA helicase PcrA [Clostridium beijerinckii]